MASRRRVPALSAAEFHRVRAGKFGGKADFLLDQKLAALLLKLAGLHGT
jgi:hypothetical protein